MPALLNWTPAGSNGSADTSVQFRSSGFCFPGRGGLLPLWDTGVPTLLQLFLRVLTAKSENVITVKPGPRGAGEGSGAVSQEAIKICDHLFPLPHLIHLSGEWFCPYPPKATNLFSCLSPCIRMNL